MAEWKAFMGKYYPTGNLQDSSNVYGYAVSSLLHVVLKQCGDNLTRENVMKQAASIKGVQLPMVLARHQGQYQRDRLLSAAVGEAGALQG